MSAFLLTVVVDLTVAVEIGMVLAAVLFIKRASETAQITLVDESTDTEGSHHSLVGKEIPKGVLVYRMFGAFFFGAADKLESVLKREKQEPDVLILRMRKVIAMDATGLNALEDLYERLQRKGKHLVLSAPHPHPLMVMEKAGFLDKLGRQNVCPHVDAALDRARELLGLPPAVHHDPLELERKHLQEARDEMALALERANKALNRKKGAAQTAAKDAERPTT
jgi:SulP family sulfate permease